MDERVLRTFIVTAELGRMDAAAKVLGYSQPTVSYQIRSLEQTLHTKLFDRGLGRMRLTEEGRLLLPSVQAVLLLFDHIRIMARPQAGHPKTAP